MSSLFPSQSVTSTGHFPTGVQQGLCFGIHPDTWVGAGAWLCQNSTDRAVGSLHAQELYTDSMWPVSFPAPTPHRHHAAGPVPAPALCSHLRPPLPEHQLSGGKVQPPLLPPLLAGAAAPWPAVFPSPSGAAPGETVDVVKEHIRRRARLCTPLQGLCEQASLPRAGGHPH